MEEFKTSYAWNFLYQAFPNDHNFYSYKKPSMIKLDITLTKPPNKSLRDHIEVFKILCALVDVAVEVRLNFEFSIKAVAPWCNWPY